MPGATKSSYLSFGGYVAIDPGTGSRVVEKGHAYCKGCNRPVSYWFYVCKCDDCLTIIDVEEILRDQRFKRGAK